MSTAAAKRYLYSHFNNPSPTVGSSSIHLNGISLSKQSSSAPPSPRSPCSPVSPASSSVISHHHRGILTSVSSSSEPQHNTIVDSTTIITSPSDLSQSAQMTPCLSPLISSASSPIPINVSNSESLSHSSPPLTITNGDIHSLLNSPFNFYRMYHPINSGSVSEKVSLAQSPASNAQLAMLSKVNEHEQQAKMERDQLAIDLVKRATVSEAMSSQHHHVPVIASTAGYNQNHHHHQQQQQQATSTGRVISLGAECPNTGSLAPEISPNSGENVLLYSMTTDNSETLNAICGNTLGITSSEAQPTRQPPQTPQPPQPNQPQAQLQSSPLSSLSNSSAASSSSSSTEQQSDSSDYGSLPGSKSSSAASARDPQSPSQFSSSDDGIHMEDGDEFNKQTPSKDSHLKRISSELDASEYCSHLSLKRLRRDKDNDLVQICNKNGLFTHEPTTPIGGGKQDHSSPMLKQNGNAAVHTLRRVLYQCTWPQCHFRCMQQRIIEHHVRAQHLGRSESDQVDNEDSDREEEFYYTEIEIDSSTSSSLPDHSAFGSNKSTSPSCSVSSSSAVSSAISPLSPAGSLTPPPTTVESQVAPLSSIQVVTPTPMETSVVTSLPISSSIVHRPSPVIATSSHYRLIGGSPVICSTAATNSVLSSKMVDMESDLPIDLSPRSKQVPATLLESPLMARNSTEQSKSYPITSPFTSPLLLVSAISGSVSTPSIVTPISPVSSHSSLLSGSFSTIYPHTHTHHRPLTDLTASAASLIQQKLFQFSLNGASTSPSSLSSHSSHSSASSASSAYFSSSPTSSTKSWSHLDEMMSSVGMKGSCLSGNESKTTSHLLCQMPSSQPDPSLVTHSVNHLLSHDPPSSNHHYGDGSVVVLNKSNVIKYGYKKNSSQVISSSINSTLSSLSSLPPLPPLPTLPTALPLDLQMPTKSVITSTSLPEIKPILATVNSSSPSGGTILPMPLTAPVNSNSNSKPAQMNTNGIPTVPRRRGRPPGSTNKKKKLQQQLQQQQQQLICAMSLMPTNGGPLNPAALAGHPFITSAGLLAPSSGDHMNHHLSCSQFAAAFAAVTAQSNGAATGLKPTSSGRKPRGESRKCRKVYGMDNREMWCTQCKWKKACSRFTE